MCGLNMFAEYDERKGTNMKDIVILIPALDPDEKLRTLINELQNAGFSKIVVVNDGSNSGCQAFFDELQKHDVTVLTHCVNLGKGRALKTGINYVVNCLPQCMGVITVDADGQHTVKDVKRCAEELVGFHNEKTILIGCRVQDDTQIKAPLRSRIGNTCTRYILRYLCGLHVSDSQSGLRAIPAKLLPRLMKVSGEGYEFETNMLLEFMDEEIEIKEIPISMVYENGNSTSHFNPVLDSLRIYTVILKYSFASLLSAGVDYLAFALMMPYSSNIFLLTFFGRAISACFNFTLNKKVVFKNADSITKQAVQYICLVIASGTVSAFCIQTICSMTGFPVMLIKVAVESLLYFVNFYIQKNYIFRKTGKKEDED